MPDMPMMPGLGGDAEAGEDETMTGNGEVQGGLAEFLASLDEETINELIKAAEEAYMNGELDRFMPGGEGGEEGNPGNPGNPGEAGESMADEMAESPEQQAGEMAAGTEMHDPATMVTTAAAMVEEIAALEGEADAVLEEAKDGDGDDTLAKDAVDIVAEAITEAEDAYKDVEKAEKDEDIEALSEASAMVEGAHQKAKAALDAAKQASAVPSAEENPGDGEEDSALGKWADSNA